MRQKGNQDSSEAASRPRGPGRWGSGCAECALGRWPIHPTPGHGVVTSRPLQTVGFSQLRRRHPFLYADSLGGDRRRQDQARSGTGRRPGGESHPCASGCLMLQDHQGADLAQPGSSVPPRLGGPDAASAQGAGRGRPPGLWRACLSRWF